VHAAAKGASTAHTAHATEKACEGVAAAHAAAKELKHTHK
jgi:hypothetical protein